MLPVMRRPGSIATVRSDVPTVLPGASVECTTIPGQVGQQQQAALERARWRRGRRLSSPPSKPAGHAVVQIAGVLDPDLAVAGFDHRDGHAAAGDLLRRQIGLVRK